MVGPSGMFKGVVHGKTIELDRAVGLPDGQAVTVVVQPSNGDPKLPPGEGVRRAFGGWAEDADELDRYRQHRKQARRDADE
jgi:hypothetical protein